MSPAGTSQEPRSSLEDLPKLRGETSQGSSSDLLEASEIALGDISGILGGAGWSFQNFSGRHLGEPRRRWRIPERNAQDFARHRKSLFRKKRRPKNTKSSKRVLGGFGGKCARDRKSLTDRWVGGEHTERAQQNLSQKAASRAPGQKSPRSTDKTIAGNSGASEVQEMVFKGTLEDWGWILSAPGDSW